MKKSFVINYDDGIIFEVNEDIDFYDEQYLTFEEAKVNLLNYWENVVSDARNKLKEVKKLKRKDAQFFSSNAT